MSRSSVGIRVKFVLVALCSVSCTLGVALLYLPMSQSRMILDGTRSKLADISRMAASFLDPGLDFEAEPTARMLVASLFTLREITGVQVYDADGGLFLENGIDLHQKVRPDWLHRDELSIVENSHSLVIITPIVDRERGERLGTLIVFASLRLVGKAISRERMVMALVVGLSVVVGVLVAMIFGTVIARPVLDLQRAAETVASGNFDVVVAERGSDEIGQLTRAFNRMTADLKRTTTSRNALSREVMERKHAYERIKALRDEAEQAARTKSEFLANMSHEIRTPMNGVIGMTELALETELTSEQREYLLTVRDSAGSLLAIIDDILDFSKIEAGCLDIAPIPTEIDDLVGMALRTVVLRAQAKGLELLGNVRPGVPATVEIDPTRVRQILVNLLGNAIKFTARGEVEVTVDVDESAGERGELHFEVRDSGIGIPVDRQEAIFQAFSQADGSTTREYGGTGLGLSICQQLVDLMGGRIWVESELGKGSRFRFAIPLPPATPRSLPVRAAVGAARSTVILDAHSRSRELLAEAFRGWGWRVTVAADGEAARYAVERTPPDLLLLDHQLDGEEGLAWLEAARAAQLTTGAVILLRRVAEGPALAARATSAGVAMTLTKPVLTSDLARAINGLFPAWDGEQRSARRAASEVEYSEVGLRVLLAEDNPVNQMLAVRMLEKRGHTVEVAANGRQAVIRAAADHYDVILMDVQMPELGGLDATAAIREAEGENAHVPIIAMTANATDLDRETCLAGGMDGFIAKPVKAEALIAEIHRVVAATA